MHKNSMTAISGFRLLACGVGLALVSTASIGQDAMFVDSSGDVGVGTNTPAASLHIDRTDADFRVQDASGTGPRTIMQLINPGGKVRFLMNAAGDKWTFDADQAGGSFNITQVGAGTNLFRVFENGDMQVTGTAFAVDHVNTSSREVKTGFTPIDETAMLEKVARIDLKQWRYKKTRSDMLHVGPMAEDFHRIFGLGDSKHISTVDTAGVAFAAIQGLNSNFGKLQGRLRESADQIEKLRSQNAELRSRLERLEGLMAKEGE